MKQAIVTAVDFSDTTPKVIETAEKLARALHRPLMLVHVVSSEPLEYVAFDMGPAVFAPPATEAPLGEAQRQRIEAMVQDLSSRGLNVAGHVIEGDPASEILAYVQDRQAEMIVLGSHGHGAIYHLLVGSVAGAVLKKARVPVVVVPVGGQDTSADTADVKSETNADVRPA